jgi:2-amino-4-hydroxy-6-hydroxymethyldihydropteridine diphosphokinase
MNTAYLLIGGNLGDRELHLEQARDLIAVFAGTIKKASAIYETAAWGNTQQPAFLNQALLLQTNQTAQQLLATALKIEKSLGRERLEKMGPRTIDIDILLFNNDIIDEPGLQVPHPAMPDRRFVLVPLAEIAGRIMHPVRVFTINDLLAQCTDPLNVKKF